MPSHHTPPAPDLAPWLATAIDMARHGGEIALDGFRAGHAAYRMKGGTDVVTVYDEQVEAFLRGEIASQFPGHEVLGEEGGGRLGEWTWVLDPIDGTENFAAGVPFWCVSVGLLHRGQPVLGVVHDPNRNETFHARLGGGAFRDDQPLHLRAPVEGTPRRIGFGLTYRRPSALSFAALEALMGAGFKPRLPGAGALALCYAAAGRYQGYFEASIHLWDIAAAQVILQEAGGWLTSGLSLEAPEQAFPVCAGAPGLETVIGGACAGLMRPDAA